MAVLWLIKGLSAGGAEQLLLSAAHVIDRERFHVEVAYLVTAHDTLAPQFALKGIPTHALDCRHEFDLRWIARLRRLLVRGRFDVLHTHSPYVAGFARPLVATLPRNRRPRLVYTEHNLWSSRAGPTRLINAWTYFMDSAQLAVSQAVWRSVPLRHRARLELLIHGTLLDEAVTRSPGDVRRELGVGPEEILLLSVANLRPAKDLHRLLHVMRQLLDRGHPVRLAIAGHGPLAAELAAVCTSLELGRHVHLLGHRSDVWALLRDSDVFVLTSRWEGLPVALMEAMAAGLPIVATDVGGIPEAVRPGVDGLLVGDPSVEGFADAVARVIVDPDMRGRMGTAAQDRAEMFDIRRSTRRLEQIYAGSKAG